MITIALQGVGWRVEQVTMPGPEGEPVETRVLVFVDQQSGITVSTPLAQSAADEIAAALRGKPHVAIAPAGAIPKVRG